MFFHKRVRMKEKESGVEVSKDKARDERNKNHKIKNKRERKVAGQNVSCDPIYNLRHRTHTYTHTFFREREKIFLTHWCLDLPD